MKDVRTVLNVTDNEIELSNRSDEIDVKTLSKETREIVNALKQTIKANDLICLAAPEIGILKRIFCIKFDTEIKTFINPLPIKFEGFTLSTEVSSVIPNKTFLRPRNTKIDIIYQRPTGQSESKQFIGKAAIVIQQMLDALDGILETDIGLEIDDDFISASEDDKTSIIKEYLDSLDIQLKSVKDDIAADSEAKKIDDGIRFMQQVASGETKLYDE